MTAFYFKRILFLFFLCSLIQKASLASGHYSQAAPKESQITFKENKGQICDQFYKQRPDILFSGNTRNLAYYLKTTGVSYQLNKIISWKKEDVLSNQALLHKNNSSPEVDKIQICRLDINWLNANPSAEILKDNESECTENYYSEACPNGALNIKRYAQLTYRELYKGIDLKWYGKAANLKYDYLIDAGADYKQIQLQINGAENLFLNKNGELIIKTPLGELTEQAPYAEQNGTPLKAKWIIKKNIVSFEVQGVNPSQPFVIDPLVRAWGTYFGGPDEETTTGIAVDNAGNSYICGETKSVSNIAISGAYQTTFGGSGSFGDAFITKFDPNGSYVWSTYYGGAQSDFANACAIDSQGNVYITGGTSTTNAPVIATPGAYQQTPAGATSPTGGTDDAFIALFDANGARLWGTYYGGSESDWAYSIASSPSGNFCIVGSTASSDGNSIATPGSHQSTYAGSNDAFVAFFNSSGSRLWGTYYGGTGAEDINYCALDASDNVYIAGYTPSGTSTVIATPGSHQPTFGGAVDGCLIKFNSAGARQWGTYYGGSGVDHIFTICIKGNDVYVSGTTTSTSGTVIATAGVYQPAYSGGAEDAFLVRFNTFGVRQWGTYYGGIGMEEYSAVAVDNSGNIYLGGYTSTASGTAIATPCTYQQYFGGGITDAFLAKLTPSGNRLWGTYYGDLANEEYGLCAVDASGKVFLCGSAAVPSSTALVSPSAYQTVYGGGATDAFLVKFDGCNPLLTADNTPLPKKKICAGKGTVLSSSVACGVQWFNVASGGNPLFNGSNFSTPLLTSDTTYYVAEVSCGLDANRTAVHVTVIASPTIVITNATPIICTGQSSTLTATGANNYTWMPASGLNSPLNFSTQVTPSVTMSYSVRGDNGTCESTTAVSINVIPNPSTNISASSSHICYGNTITLNANGAETYTWFPSGLTSMNAASISITPTVNTTYTVTGANNNGTILCVNQSTYAVTILPQSPAAVTGSQSICEGSNVVLTANGGSSFIWTPTSGIYNLSNNQVIVSPTVSTVYSVDVSSANFCASTATVAVTVFSKPTIFAGRDTVFSFEEPLILTAKGTGTVSWVSGEAIACADCASTEVFPTTNNSCYVAQAINDFGCTEQDMVCVSLNNESAIYIENAFTPNNDGLNDVFYVYGFNFYKTQLDIFNRWGEKLFTSTNQQVGWDGRFHGVLSEAGVYAYTFTYNVSGGKQLIKTGFMTLVR